ncbi:LVIVD repeat-containing protein [Azospirillum sp. ST 5-10]|uniref:LVIVD repeat-containing protein n=1 Tax=unclassified Azospirillum TaxID=2630922 RepID=UPI003F49C186
MPQSLNTTHLSHIDCPGGGQVWVDGTTLYIGHMRPPSGTTIVDVADPRNPKVIARITVPDGWHSHKVRVSDGIMIVNHERFGQDAPEFGGGLGIYDVSRPAEPRLISKWQTAGKGVHRYDFDGRYAYISPTAEGFIGNIAMILDLADPVSPREVGRWWIPGQWQAGGEEYPWDPAWPTPRCHHPLRLGDRLYVSYWHHGLFILDVSDLSSPKPVAALNTSRAFPHPTHTCLPIPQTLKGRRIMVVADEDVAKLYPAPPAFTWIYDITDERTPVPISTFQVAGIDTTGEPQPPMTGCHQPSERFSGSIIPFAWFAQGLRLVDIADPFAPQEVGHFVPDVPAGSQRASSNDVTLDERGIIYLIDRVHGVDIIETSVFG